MPRKQYSLLISRMNREFSLEQQWTSTGFYPGRGSRVLAQISQFREAVWGEELLGERIRGDYIFVFRMVLVGNGTACGVEKPGLACLLVLVIFCTLPSVS